MGILYRLVISDLKRLIEFLAFMIPAVCGGIVFASPYILHEILKVDERMNQTAEVEVEP